MSTLESAVGDLTAFHMACDVPILPSPTVPPRALLTGQDTGGSADA